MSEKKERWILAAVLPLIVILLLAVWGAKPRTDEMIIETSANGFWDLSETDIRQKAVRLTGAVEYVADALLTPQEFSERPDIHVGQPGSEIQYATSRMHLTVPQGSYLICG